MRKLVCILLLSIYVLAYGEGHQLLRIPYLVKHYQKHKQADPNMTIARFIRIHYIEQVPQGDDFLQDIQLPFRYVDVNQMASLYEHEPVLIELHPPTITETVFHSCDEVNKPISNTIDIFQPPRNA